MYRDIFFAIIAAWIFFKIKNAFHVITGSSSGQAPGQPQEQQKPQKKPGSVSVDYIPPQKKGKHDIEDSEYVDYEEIKK
jgi:hypothetical protein